MKSASLARIEHLAPNVGSLLLALAIELPADSCAARIKLQVVELEVEVWCARQGSNL
jgi:hypothetical protein